MINYVMTELNNKSDERIGYVSVMNVFTVPSSFEEEKNRIHTVTREYIRN